MKRTVLFVLMLAAVSAAAQQRNPVVPSFTGAVEDFKPNVTNQLGHQYPMVNSQGAVRAQLRARRPRPSNWTSPASGTK